MIDLSRPSTDQYGEWLNYIADLIRRDIARSNREHLAAIPPEHVRRGRWIKPRNWPWIFISYVRHPIIGANVSGGSLHAEFTYDIVVENTHRDLDVAEFEAMNIIGDILSLLIIDEKMQIDFDGVREARGIRLEIMDPLQVIDPQNSDKFVWAGLRVVVEKKLNLV